jgi:hypothetical protein
MKIVFSSCATWTDGRMGGWMHACMYYVCIRVCVCVCVYIYIYICDHSLQPQTEFFFLNMLQIVAAMCTVVIINT